MRCSETMDKKIGESGTKTGEKGIPKHLNARAFVLKKCTLKMLSQKGRKKGGEEKGANCCSAFRADRHAPQTQTQTQRQRQRETVHRRL